MACSVRLWPVVCASILVSGLWPAGASRAGADGGRGEATGVVRFSADDAGRLPKGWTAARTGEGEGSLWRVVRDPTTPSGAGYVLAQLAESPRPMFNLCVLEGAAYRDVQVEVAFKAVRGKVDQGGGIVWRYQDAKNYYVARMNPLEDNYRFYKVVRGRRTQLATREGVRVPPGQWHRLGIRCLRSKITCKLDGRVVLEAEDDTFTQPGAVGLWTKADAQTYFDNLVVTGLGTQGNPPAEHGAEEVPAVWESQYTTTPPVVDGVVDEVWQRAKPLTVTVRKALGGRQPRPVELRALHTHHALYILARWADRTKSDMRDPYVWNRTKRAYERPSRPDDQFALEFPLRGKLDINMLVTGRDYVADVWHWKAGRGNPAGWVDDKRHIISQEPNRHARRYSLGGHADVYVARLMDEGTPSYVLTPPPQGFQGDLVDSFQPQRPTGSLADVRGKGVHDGRRWTLEMSRKLNTGHADDTAIDPGGDTPCAIAVLDDELYWHHSVSGLLMLRFLGGA